jgi:hypothetical protein
MIQPLKEGILAIHGITDMVRSRTTETNGRWNILTDETNFHQVLQFIRCNLPFWLERMTFQWDL